MPGPGDLPGPGKLHFFPSGPTLRVGFAFGSSQAAMHQAARQGLKVEDPGINGKTVGLAQDICAFDLAGKSVNGTRISRLQFVTSGEGGINVLHTQPDDDHGDKIANPPNLVEGRIGAAAGFQYDQAGGLHMALEGTSGMNLSRNASGYVGGRLSVGMNFTEAVQSPCASLFLQYDRGVVGELKGNAMASVGLAIRLK